MRRIQTTLAILLGVGFLLAIPGSGRAKAVQNAVEPGAGAWRTWVLSAGSQFRVAPPPDTAATSSELAQLKSLAGQRNAAMLNRIAYWDTGSPGYRWNSILRDEFTKHGLTTVSGTINSRALSLLDVAIYDATIAAWDSKYTYNRVRPSELDPILSTVGATPASPAYPSEHAAVAGAAATVLAYLYPDEADALAALADEAAQSRVDAGVQFPSDTTIGLDLGRKVGAAVVERGRTDGSAIPWDGYIPNEPGLWSLAGYPEGATVVGPTFGSLRPWVLESGSQFRPGPPPAPDSEEKLADLEEIKNVPRNFVTNSAAFFWQSPRSDWTLVADEKIAQYHLDADPPRAARVDALATVTFFDAAVACWNAKFTYWAARPHQLDPDVHPLFPPPAHPSYPAAHGCVSGSQAAILAALFPADAQTLTDQANQAAESRIMAGIHFRSDITAGLALGRAVAERVIEWSRTDGANN